MFSVKYESYIVIWPEFPVTPSQVAVIVVVPVCDGVKYPLESGYLIDGLSTDKERIMYTANTFSNKIYINGEEMDLSETGRYSIVNFNDDRCGISKISYLNLTKLNTENKPRRCS